MALELNAYKNYTVIMVYFVNVNKLDNNVM